MIDRLNAGAARPRVDIDLDAIAANYRYLRSKAPAAEAGAVVKCDAYGLGVVEAARMLAEQGGCRSFFVAYAHEGAVLRGALASGRPDATIYVFNGPDDVNLDAFAENNLIPVLNSFEQARRWTEARPGAAAAIHIDTGMNRLGAPAGELDAIIGLDGLSPTLVMSHLACSSVPAHPMNERQRRDFIAAAGRFPAARRSLAASGGTLMGRDYHFDLLRAGVSIYGVGPFDAPHDGLRPTARLTAPVLQLRRAPAGASAGYGATCTLSRESLLATVALGYGDGYPRAAGNRGAAFIGGARAPIVGRVSMDLIILDVTDAPKPVKIGDRAEFFGPNLAIEDAAAACGTIGYELLTGLGGRTERHYV
ncbi:MAG: alanine racemase [Parvularculaceae bacterium]